MGIKAFLKKISCEGKKLPFKVFDRHSLESLAKGSNGDTKGLMFMGDAGMFDLSGVNIVGCSVDTVRQLYRGVLDEGFIAKMDEHIQRDEVMSIKAKIDKAVNCEFHVTKMAKSCGYRYKLQNNDAGLVVLVGSYYQKPEIEGAHLKIECSPHFLVRNRADLCQRIMNSIARAILHDVKPSGVAIHLATDLQGWKPPVDFFDRFKTYARTVRNYLGLLTMEIGEGFSEVAATYGKGEAQTYTIGKPTGLQTSVYNKTKQAVAVDKLDYFQAEWASYSLGGYAHEKDVYRVEFRFHHSVINEVSVGESGDFNTYEALATKLQNLWQYALIRNRLECMPGHIDPVWQMLFEDVQFTTDRPLVMPVRKKKECVAAISKNFDLIMGNMLSVYARRPQFTAKDVMKQLSQMAFYDDLLRYYRQDRKIGETELRERIAKGLLLRRMTKNAA